MRNNVNMNIFIYYTFNNNFLHKIPPQVILIPSIENILYKIFLNRTRKEIEKQKFYV